MKVAAEEAAVVVVDMDVDVVQVELTEKMMTHLPMIMVLQWCIRRKEDKLKGVEGMVLLVAVTVEDAVVDLKMEKLLKVNGLGGRMSAVVGLEEGEYPYCYDHQFILCCILR